MVPIERANLANKWPPTFISNKKKACRLADRQHKCFGQNKIKSPYTWYTTILCHLDLLIHKNAMYKEEVVHTAPVST